MDDTLVPFESCWRHSGGGEMDISHIVSCVSGILCIYCNPLGTANFGTFIGIWPGNGISMQSLLIGCLHNAMNYKKTKEAFAHSNCIFCKVERKNGNFFQNLCATLVVSTRRNGFLTSKHTVQTFFTGKQTLVGHAFVWSSAIFSAI